MRAIPLKRRACALLAAVLAFSAVGAPVARAVPGGGSALEDSAAAADSAAAPAAETDAVEKIETTISHQKRQGVDGADYDGNYFEFSENGWSAWDGTDDLSEHVWSDNPSDSLPAESIYYEVTFYGSKIDIYSGKNKPMGWVKYTVDAGTDSEVSQEHNLYNSGGNINRTYITTFDGLGEGRHVLRAQATGRLGSDTDPKKGAVIDCADVVVTHAPYVPTAMTSPQTAGVEVPELGTAAIQVEGLEPDYVTLDDLKFSSKDDAIAAVDESGVVTGRSAGATTITVAPKSDPDSSVKLEIPVTVSAVAPKMDGFISDVDTQWTQDRYDEAKTEATTTGPERPENAPTTRAAADTADDSGTLSAWKNDAAISEITLVSLENTPLKDVSISTEGFTSADGAKITDVDLSFVGSTKAYNKGFLGYGHGPNRDYDDDGTNRAESNDVLLGSDPIDVLPGKLQNVFVKVNVPKDAPAGDYTGIIKVEAKDYADPLEFEYTLKVQDAVLPDASTFGETFDVELWQYPYSSAEYYGVDPFSDGHFEILKPIMELYKSVGGHAITTTISEDAWSGQTYADDTGAHNTKVHYPSMVRWEMKNGQMTYDFTNFDKWVEWNRDVMGIGDKIILYSIVPWHGNITYYEGGALKTVKAGNLNGSGHYTGLTNEGRRYWRHFLNAMVAHLEEKGWFDDAYVGIDERGFCADAFDLIDSVKNSKGESLKTAGAIDAITNADKRALSMRVDDLNIGDFAAQQAGDSYDNLVKERNDAGLRTTLYSCTEHYPGNFSLSNPVETYWSIINAEKDGNTSGFLRWAYDAWVDDPLNDATHWSFEPGDCFLIYPGADKAAVEQARAEGRELTEAEKTAKSSIRLERMAEGVRDANKIKKMRSEVSDMRDDIQAVYDGIKTIADKRTNRDWSKVDTEMAQLDTEMSKFKQDLDTLTATYVKAVDGQKVEPASVTISGDGTVGVGSELTLTVETDGLSKDVTWSSSNPDIATVDINGKVTARKAGVTTITATSVMNSEVKGEKRIVVTAPKAEIDPVNKIAHYGFEDDAVDDWTGSARSDSAQNGTVNSGVTFADGKVGKAAVLDGDAGKTITIPNNAFGLDGDRAWTVGYWVMTTEPLDGQSLPLMDETGTWAFALRLADAENRNAPGFRVGKADGDVLSFGFHGDLKPNEWYRIAWVNDPNLGLSMYVNGRTIANDKVNGWTADPKNDARVAQMQFPVEVIGGSGFKGMIDELAVYDRALSEAEVNAMLGEFSPSDAGLGLEAAEKTIYEGESFGISGNFGEGVTFSVEQENIADDSGDVVTVSRDGVVSGDLRGNATITVTDGGKTDTMTVRVKRSISISNQAPTPILADEYQSDVYGVDDIKADGYWDQGKKYYGQADMVRTRDGKLVTCFPQGHGVGKAMVRISDDDGETWRDPKNGTPACFDQSRETPTIYALDMPDGTERLIIISANPIWGSDNGDRGWNTSISDDGGETWSDYKRFHEKITVDGKEIDNPAIVGMASLVQLRDDNGKPLHKWMGVYHHGHNSGNFTNFKTYLTFEKGSNGEWVEQWSEPELLLPNSRDIEKRYQMCEIGMFRSPDGERIIGLCRSQSHNNPSTLIYSDDEGQTWSEPLDLPGSLAGERHKPFYDPQTGLVVVPFRGIRFDTNYDNKFGGGSDWTCDDWDMWVGTYEQLMNQEDGLFRMRIDEDFSTPASGKSGDTGYTGIVALDDGTLVMDSYGHWEEQRTDPNDVYKDLATIRQAKFSLKDVLINDHGYTVPAQITVDLGLDGAPVAFAADSAAENATMWVNIGEKLLPQLPAAPERAGYRFDGWMLDDGTAVTPIDENTVVERKATVHAKWTEVADPAPLEFWVAFDLNYEGAPAAELRPVKADGLVDAPADPTREGFAFEGWFTEKECVNAFDVAATTVGANMRLYAKWTPVEKPVDPDEPEVKEFKVTFDLNYKGAPKAEVVKTKDGKVAKPVDPTRDGYAFKGWFTDAEGTGAFDFNTKIDADTTLYAKWAKSGTTGGAGGQGGNNDQGGNNGQGGNPGDNGAPNTDGRPNGNDSPSTDGKPGQNGQGDQGSDSAKPGPDAKGDAKPNGGLPKTGDDSLLYIGGAAVAGAAVIAVAVFLLRRRKNG